MSTSVASMWWRIALGSIIAIVGCVLAVAGVMVGVEEARKEGADLGVIFEQGLILVLMCLSLAGGGLAIAAKATDSARRGHRPDPDPWHPPRPGARGPSAPEVPLRSADQIRRREFALVRRGYDEIEVRSYLEEIAELVDAWDHGVPPESLEGRAPADREFSTTRRGYEPDQVRAFLDMVAKIVDEMARGRRVPGWVQSAPAASRRNDVEPER